MLPAAPALARPDALPRAAGWSFEVKWDGIRALLSTENGLRIKSRRGWDMTDRLPELAELPAGLVLDGELVAFQGSVPHWPLVCDRVLHRRSVPIVYQLFDILAVEGHSVMSNTYAQRRALLEALDLNGPCWQTPDRFDDGEALLSSVCQLGLEGVIAKRTNGPSGPASATGSRSRTAATGASATNTHRCVVRQRRVRIASALARVIPRTPRLRALEPMRHPLTSRPSPAAISGAKASP